MSVHHGNATACLQVDLLNCAFCAVLFQNKTECMPVAIVGGLGTG